MRVANGFPRMVFMGFSATRYTGTTGRFWVEVLRLLLGVDHSPQGLVDAVDSSFHFLPAVRVSTNPWSVRASDPVEHGSKRVRSSRVAKLSSDLLLFRVSRGSFRREKCRIGLRKPKPTNSWKFNNGCQP